jgi:hypothetical protein
MGSGVIGSPRKWRVQDHAGFTSQAQFQKSFLLLFFKKEGLAL